MRRLVARTAVLAAIALALAPAPARAGIYDLVEVEGEVRHFAFAFETENWAVCDGRSVLIAQNPRLFGVFGTTFGTDDDGLTSFALPELPNGVERAAGRPVPKACTWGAYPVQFGFTPALDTAGALHLMPVSRYRELGWLPCDGTAYERAAFPALADRLGVPQAASTFRVPAIPSQLGGALVWYISAAGEASLGGYLGELRRWPAAAPMPDGWAACDGAVLPIKDNSSLYFLFEDAYGGTPGRTFNLPQLPDEDGFRWIICTAGVFPARPW